jgi:aspartate racemase
VDRHRSDVPVPVNDERTLVYRVIHEELMQGRVEPSSRQTYREVIARLIRR